MCWGSLFLVSWTFSNLIVIMPVFQILENPVHDLSNVGSVHLPNEGYNISTTASSPSEKEHIHFSLETSGKTFGIFWLMLSSISRKLQNSKD